MVGRINPARACDAVLTLEEAGSSGGRSVHQTERAPAGCGSIGINGGKGQQKKEKEKAKTLRRRDAPQARLVPTGADGTIVRLASIARTADDPLSFIACAPFINLLAHPHSSPDVAQGKTSVPFSGCIAVVPSLHFAEMVGLCRSAMPLPPTLSRCLFRFLAPVVPAFHRCCS
jgi:hypothetical protein